VYSFLLIKLYRGLVFFVGQSRLNHAIDEVERSRGRSAGMAGTLFGSFVRLLYQLNLIDHFRSSTGLGSESSNPGVNAVNHNFDEHYFHLRLNRVFDLPEVVVDATAPKYINVLVPAFSISSISAGFFGVFAIARYCAKLGYRTRFVFFDNFLYSDDEFRKSLGVFPAFRDLCSYVDLHYIGARAAPLRVSPDDAVVATVWYSAYFAQKISRVTNRSKFLYLVQDYETVFFPSNSLFTLAERTYDMDYVALVSTQPLFDFMRSKFPRRIGGDNAAWFNNACTSSMPSRDELKKRLSTSSRKFVFYCRPVVDRNMFELCSLAMITAHKLGVFLGKDWELYGIGLGEATITLFDGRKVEQLPRMTLEEYERFVGSVDLCLSLMASPHPSMIPFDMSASAAIVVTNTFFDKTPDYLQGISKNVLPSEPTLDSLVETLRVAVQRVEDAEARILHAKINAPKHWEDVWEPWHAKLLTDTFGAP
jgi:hypothetical protein